MKHLFTFEKLDDTSDEETIEEEMIAQYCASSVSEMKYVKEPPLNSIPIGSVQWCEKVYGKHTPDYYPDFLKDYLHRKIWKCQFKNIKENDKPLFIKPSEDYKSWNGFVYSKNTSDIKIKDDEYIICSDVVHFINEWRYYIINGKVLESAWYDGDISDEDVLKGLAKKSPKLPDKLLSILEENNYYGVIDMGEIMKDGKLEFILVETCHPYAIGWYLESNSYKNYAKFLIESDKYLKKRIYEVGQVSQINKDDDTGKTIIGDNIIIEKWITHKLRDLSYVNFAFENPSLIEHKILKLPTKDSEAILEDDSGLAPDTTKYFENSYNNVKTLVNDLLQKEDDNIIVYGEIGTYCDIAYIVDKYNQDYLRSNLTNIEIVKKDAIIKGSCNTEQLFNLIHGSLASEHGDVFDCEEDYNNKTIFNKLLYYFPNQQLYLYIYDTRGGILNSECQDIHKLQYYFFKYSNLLNTYHLKSMILQLNIGNLRQNVLDGITNYTSVSQPLLDMIGESVRILNLSETYDQSNEIGLDRCQMYYSIACAYSYLGEIDKSFNFLYKSIENGYFSAVGYSIEDIINDTRLENIQKNTRFTEFINHLTLPPGLKALLAEAADDY